VDPIYRQLVELPDDNQPLAFRTVHEGVLVAIDDRATRASELKKLS
jgi:hypothetical protein